MVLLSAFHADVGFSWSKSLSAKFSPVQITEHQKGCGEKKKSEKIICMSAAGLTKTGMDQFM